MPVKAPPPAPVPLPYNWGGLYLGGYVGYLWGRTRVEEDGLVTEPNAATNGVIGGVLRDTTGRQGLGSSVLKATSAGPMHVVRDWSPTPSFNRMLTT